MIKNHPPPDIHKYVILYVKRRNIHMDSFGINITLYQGMIVEQQITNFVLENEYNKELGVVTEADQESKLKAAGKWIKEKIDYFIGVIKTWFGKITHFLTKTLPQWISKQINRLLVLLHIRQKSVKIDDSKISEGNKEKVKETCKKANKLNIFKFIKNKKKDEKSDDLSNDLKDIAASLEKTLDAAGEARNRMAEVNKKYEEQQKKNEEFEKQVDKDLQEAKEFLKELEEKSNDAAEKAEIKKANDAIGKGETIEMASENLNYLEGSIIDLKLVDKFDEFWLSALNRLSFNVPLMSRSIKEGIKNYDNSLPEIPGKDLFKWSDIRTHDYYSYSKAKAKENMNIQDIKKSKAKRKIEKTKVEYELNFLNTYEKLRKQSIDDIKKGISNTIDTLNSEKKKDQINHKILRTALNNCNFFMKESTLMLNDITALYTLAISECNNFLITATPCSGN